MARTIASAESPWNSLADVSAGSEVSSFRSPRRIDGQPCILGRSNRRGIAADGEAARLEGGALFRLYQDGDTVVLTFLPYDPDVEGAGLVGEAAMAAITVVLRDLFGTSWEPSEVYLPRRLPEDCRPYNAFFRAPVRFDEEVAGFPLLQGAISIVQLQPTSQHRPRATDGRLATEAATDVVEDLRRLLRVEMLTHRLSSGRAAERLCRPSTDAEPPLTRARRGLQERGRSGSLCRCTATLGGHRHSAGASLGSP